METKTAVAVDLVTVAETALWLVADLGSQQIVRAAVDVHEVVMDDACYDSNFHRKWYFEKEFYMAVVGDYDRTCNWMFAGEETLCRHPVGDAGEQFQVESVAVPSQSYSFERLASISIVVGVSGSTFVGFESGANDYA